mmetsp:Transcript_7655/g.23337  ORF Transcript_7655/g.23337 Transcript_7655/m.23337 type:complete len:215 (-) Transcript_7655:776-1420(-)
MIAPHDGRARILAHAVHLQQVHAHAAKVRQRVERDRGSAADKQAALIQAQRAADAAKDELVRQPPLAAPHRALATDARVVVGLTDPLGPRRQPAQRRRYRLAYLEHALLELGPHARHAEEDGGLGQQQRLLEATLKRVGAREEGGGLTLPDARPHDGSVHVGVLRGDVRQRQGRHDAQGLAALNESLVHLEPRLNRPSGVVVRDHHRLGVACGA